MCDWNDTRTNQREREQHYTDDPSNANALESKLDGMMFALQKTIQASQRQWFEDMIMNVDDLRKQTTKRINEVMEILQTKADVKQVQEIKSALENTPGSAAPTGGSLGVNPRCPGKLDATQAAVDAQFEVMEELRASLDRKAAVEQLDELKGRLDDLRAAVEEKASVRQLREVEANVAVHARALAATTEAAEGLKIGGSEAAAARASGAAPTHAQGDAQGVDQPELADTKALIDAAADDLRRQITASEERQSQRIAAARRD